MKRTVTAIIAVIILMAWRPEVANAQQPDPGIEYVELPPAIAACVAKCKSPAARAAATEAVDTAKRLGALEKRYAELAGQIGALRGRNASTTAQLVVIREDIRKLRESLQTLTTVTEDEFLRTGIALYGLNESLAGVNKRLDAMDSRLSALERKGNPFKLSPLAGGLVLWSTDGTLYTGFPVGARLKLNLTDSIDLNVDGAALLSISKEPFGSAVRGGLTFGLTPNWAVETGLGTSWVGYNSQLKARSAFLTGDVGITFRISRFWIAASVLAGAEFDKGSPAFALGGNALLGVEFF